MLGRCVAQANLRNKCSCRKTARSGLVLARYDYLLGRRVDGCLFVVSSSGADDAEVAAAAHLDALADRFRYGRARLAGALGPLRATGTALAAGGP